MKRLMVLLALVLLAGTGVTLTAAAPKDETGGIKGKEVSVTGRLGCTFCSLAHPDKACKKGCCSGCIQAGDPPLLIDQQGNMYILLTNEIKKPLMTPERLEMAGDQVVIKGLLVKGKGIQVIFVDSLTKPQPRLRRVERSGRAGARTPPGGLPATAAERVRPCRARGGPSYQE